MLHNKFIHTYDDPAIAFPWWGKRGLCITIQRGQCRGFGVWVHRERKWRPSLYIGIWWCWIFERSHNPLV